MHTPPRKPRLVIVAPTLHQAQAWLEDNAAAAGIGPDDYLPLFVTPRTERLYGVVLRPGDHIMWHPALDVATEVTERIHAVLAVAASAGNARLQANKVVAR